MPIQSGLCFSRTPGLGTLIRVTVVAALLIPVSALDAQAGDRKRMGKSTPAGLYHNYCSVCHGDGGDGQSRAKNGLIPPPANFTDPKLKDRLTVAYIAAITKEGKAGTAMVGWKTQLNDADIDGLAKYVRTTFVEQAASPAMKKGRTFYGHFCVNCHGIDGKGGELPKNAGGAPGQRVPDLTTPDRLKELSRDRMIAAVAVGRPGTPMKGFSGQLPPEDIEAIVDYMRTQVFGAGMESISGVSATGKK